MNDCYFTSCADLCPTRTRGLTDRTGEVTDSSSPRCSSIVVVGGEARAGGMSRVITTITLGSTQQLCRRLLVSDHSRLRSSSSRQREWRHHSATLEPPGSPQLETHHESFLPHGVPSFGSGRHVLSLERVVVVSGTDAVLGGGSIARPPQDADNAKKSVKRASVIRKVKRGQV